MTVFFNGRLLVTPTTASTVDDSALHNRGLSVGNVLALIGKAEGGKPNTALRFGSPSEARAVLRGGELLDAVLKAFDPSPQTGSPATIVAVRVDPATQATLTLKDGGGDNAITLKSTDYGLYTNQIKVKVESGSSVGKKVTVQLGNDYFTADNIARSAFSVEYGGSEATAIMTISNDTIVLEAPADTEVAEIDLNTYKTVQQVVDRINSVADFTASVLDGNGEQLVLNGLDSVTDQDVKSAAFTVTANLQAVIDWLNSSAEGFVTATRADDAGAAPANIGFTYLSGGSNGSVTNSEWSDAYTTLQAEDVQWVVPVTSDASIHAMNDTHCAFMSSAGRMERRGIVGTALSTSDSDAKAAAKALNSDRTSLVHLGFYDYDAAGALSLYPPYILAAAIAGAFAGVSPGTPLTNKAIKVRGLERKLRNPVDTDLLIEAGVLCVEETAQGFKVVKSISTWISDDSYNRVEVSTGVAVDFIARNVRNALDVLRGEKASPISLSRAVSITESTLRELARPEPQGPGVIVGNEASPPYRGIRASIESDVLRVEFQCSPVLPLNYVLVSIFAVPFSGSAAA